MTETATVAAALSWASRRLATAGIDDPRLEARILLEHCLGLSRVQLYCQPDRPLAPEELGAYLSPVARRADREPLAYVVGHREFFGLDFLVDPRVLVPRPETELLVEEALRVLRELPSRLVRPLSHALPNTGRGADAAPPSRCGKGARGLGWLANSTQDRPDGESGSTPGWPLRIADVGTGSGAIAVSLAVNRPDALVYALDVSADALEVAAENLRRHGVAQRVALLRGDLLQALPAPVDLIVANLPYVATADLADPQPEVAREPRLALDGGVDGLEVYRRLLAQVPSHLRPGGALLFEVGAGQGAAAVALARQVSPDATVRLVEDHVALDRVVVVRLPLAPEVC